MEFGIVKSRSQSYYDMYDCGHNHFLLEFGIDKSRLQTYIFEFTVFLFADDDSWDLVTCFCMKPFAGRAMIECNQCNTWIHLSCAKIRKSNVPETYICQRCKDSKFDIRRSNRSRVGSRKHLLDWCRSSRSAHPHVQKLIKMSSWRWDSMSTEEEGLADLPVSLFLFPFLIFLTFLNVCVRQSILRQSINESRFPPYGRLEMWRYTPEGITLCCKEGIGVSDCTFFFFLRTKW